MGNEQKEEMVRGLIQVNGEMVGFDRKLEAMEMVMHRMHRHEPPVSSQDVDIVYEDGVILAVDKPGSMPVHPTGRYRHNTVMYWLAREKGIRNLYPVHRLDKLTSGLLLFARNPQKAEQIASAIRSTQVQKTYLARVEGKFPNPQEDEEEEVETVRKKRETSFDGAVVVCEAPILVTNDIGLRELNRVDFSDSRAKPCETHFKRLFYDGTHSVVECKPKTGRTHQIRVHLSYLGHVIANDPLYNPRYRDLHAEPWEIEMAENDADGNEQADTQIFDAENASALATAPSSSSSPPSVESHPLPLQSSSLPSSSSLEGHEKESKIPSSSPPPSSPEPNDAESRFSNYIPNNPKINIEDADPRIMCALCKVVWRRPKEFELRIWLHALRYEGEHFSYETATPPWALETFITDPQHQEEVKFVASNEKPT